MVGVKSMLDSRMAKDIANGVLGIYSEFGKPNAKVDQTKLSKFFSPNFEYKSNEHVIGKSLQQFMDRIKDVQKRFPKITYSRLLEEPIISGNKMIIRYNADLTSASGQKQESKIFAILTIEDDKITHWNEVIHEKLS